MLRYSNYVTNLSQILQRGYMLLQRLNLGLGLVQSLLSYRFEKASTTFLISRHIEQSIQLTMYSGAFCLKAVYEV